jgi:hypothetical protein
MSITSQHSTGTGLTNSARGCCGLCKACKQQVAEFAWVWQEIACSVAVCASTPPPAPSTFRWSWAHWPCIWQVVV